MFLKFIKKFKECIFCSLKNNELLDLGIYQDGVLLLEKEENNYYIIIDTEHDYDEIKINYCPMCGRRLGD